MTRAPIHGRRPALRAACGALAVLNVLIAVALSLPSTSRAQVTADLQASERSVMAAYIYRFITYAEWPAAAFASADAPIVIGVVNADDIAVELEQIVRGRVAQNRPLQVRRMAPGDAPTDVHVLFVSREVAPKFFQVAKTWAARPVLTITDAERGVDLGSMINFVQADGRVRFEVNVAVAEKNGLRLSSRLLTVATRVKPG